MFGQRAVFVMNMPVSKTTKKRCHLLGNFGDYRHCLSKRCLQQKTVKVPEMEGMKDGKIRNWFTH